MNDIEIRKKIFDTWFTFLQSQICEQFVSIEKNILLRFKKSLFKMIKINIQNVIRKIKGYILLIYTDY